MRCLKYDEKRSVIDLFPFLSQLHKSSFMNVIRDIIAKK